MSDCPSAIAARVYSGHPWPLEDPLLRRLIIVEDHPLYALALRSVIEGAFTGLRIREAVSLADACSQLAAEPADLVLLDLWLPDASGLEGLMALRRQHPKLPVVVISAFADRATIVKVLACGAAGFVPKSQGKAQVVSAIRSVIEGGVAVPDRIAAWSTDECLDGTELGERLRRLTHKQLLVLEMLCHGKLNKQIAYDLGIGETTVKAHVGEILKKLGVSSRTQAVVEVAKLDFPLRWSARSPG